jgi:ankyrin repeat protein
MWLVFGLAALLFLGCCGKAWHDIRSAVERRKQDSALTQALVKRDEAEVKAALRAGADATGRNGRDDQGAFFPTFDFPNEDPILVLYSDYATIRTKGVRNRQPDPVEIARALIDAGANANAAYGDGTPVVVKAADRGYFGSVELMLQHGADVNAKDGAGRTLLMKAVGQKDEKAVRMLLRLGADRRPTYKNRTAEQWAKKDRMQNILADFRAGR